MRRFIFDPAVKNREITLETGHAALDKLSEYICLEHTKGKIPLIIAGAGISAANLRKTERTSDELQEILFEGGLPCLGRMIKKVSELVLTAAEEAGPPDKELKKLEDLFQSANSSGGKLLDHMDREWLGKIFSALSDSPSKAVAGIWDNFCNWFFFDCCQSGEHKGGALDISTSDSAKEIAKLYSKLDAICLSANFDDFIEFSLAGEACMGRGISLFNKKYIDQYFRRVRRNRARFDEPAQNRCVLHANGDVLWLHCSGDKDEGYCPQRGKYMPAFANRKKLSRDDILKCQICGSRMLPTMTMPGTYEKDHNTRQILSSIWEHIASKISCVITVGLSCNWDEVLLKFILEFLIERDIPHLDINNFSDPDFTGKTALYKRVVSEPRFQSCCICADAQEGLSALNEAIDTSLRSAAKVYEADSVEEHGLPPFAKEAHELLENEDVIKRLMHVSQLGLKALIVKDAQKNNRWTHSKEVASNAYQLYHRLCENSGKKETQFEQVLLYMAGLLHDCGHLPFSHLLEDVFEELSWGFSNGEKPFKHDQFSKLLIQKMCAQENSGLRSFLERYGVTPEEVMLLIEGNYGVGILTRSLTARSTPIKSRIFLSMPYRCSERLCWIKMILLRSLPSTRIFRRRE